jgi:hypothetical protein
VDDQEGVDMCERTAEPATGALEAPDDAIDRSVWTKLRRAAHRGLLLPEGFKLVDELHDLHPEWRAQW